MIEYLEENDEDILLEYLQMIEDSYEDYVSSYS